MSDKNDLFIFKYFNTQYLENGIPGIIEAYQP